MPEADALVARLDRAVAGFRDLVERLNDRQWALRGVNTPGPRFFPEDEDRPVGVIAWHVAAWLPRHTDLMRARLTGDQQMLDANAINAEEASAHAGATRSEVLERLAAEAPGARAFIAGVTDEQLDHSWETRVGRMDLRTAIERVLIGHVDMHRASIEASIEQEEGDG